jgi:hypothetical protein
MKDKKTEASYGDLPDSPSVSEVKVLIVALLLGLTLFSDLILWLVKCATQWFGSP